MTTMILGLLFSAAIGPNAHAQTNDQVSVTNPAAVTAPMSQAADVQDETGEDPGRGGGGGRVGGGGAGRVGGGHAGGGHVGAPNRGGGMPNRGGGVGHANNPGRPGNPGAPGHVGPRPGAPGHVGGPGRTGPGRVGPGRTIPGAHRAPGDKYWGGRPPGHYYGRGFHRPGWNSSFIWNPGLYPFWWAAGIEFAPFVWIDEIPAGEFQCTAFDSTMQAYSDVGDSLNEAAYNTLYSCGGPNYQAEGCYIPTGYCRRR